MVSYFIHPTPALKKVLVNYPNHDWVKPQLWQMERFWGTPRGEPLNIEILTKALHLVSIAKVETPDGLIQNLRNVLFGDTPQYNISTFDRWWTIEQCKSHWNAEDTFEQAKPEHYAAIEGTGYSVIDNWLSSMSNPAKYEMMKKLHSKNERTIFIRYPIPNLLDIVAEKPINLWTRDTILYLPSHIMSLQPQYVFPLLKVLYLVHLGLHGNPYGTKSSWMQAMFGNPPRYNIENFDKWWIIEPLRCVGDMQQIYDDYPHDKALQRAFARIELTGHEGTDAWLKRMGVGLDKS